MKAKELIINFINLLFLIFIIGFFILFFISGDHFSTFQKILKAMIPLAFIGVIFLIKIRLSQRTYKKAKIDGNDEIYLRINLLDKLVIEAVVLLIPTVILVIPIIFGTLGAVDIIQACFGFLGAYLIYKIVFKRNNYN